MIVKAVATFTVENPVAADVQLQQVFIGNSYDPDPMTAVEDLYQPNATVAAFKIESPNWPTGLGMELPGSGDTGQDGPHIDVHLGGCRPTGATYWGFLNVWYTRSQEGR